MKVFRLLALPIIALACASGAAHAQDEATAPGDIVVPEPPKWERSLDFGINGSSGNTDVQNLYAAFNAHKATDKETIDFVTTYRLNESNGQETDNRLYSQGRYTWLLTDSKWGIYAQGTFELDRFKAWDQRYTGSIGPSYRFIDNDKTFFEGRAGIGFVGIFGGEGEDNVDPEAVIGAALRHKFNDKWSITANAELFPNLNETGEYRFLGDAGVEYHLAETWAIKAGVQEVYDSNPGPNAEKSDFYYVVTLSAKF